MLLFIKNTLSNLKTERMLMAFKLDNFKDFWRALTHIRSKNRTDMPVVDI